MSNIGIWDLKEQLVRLDHEAYRSINVCNIILESGDDLVVRLAKSEIEQLRRKIDDILLGVQNKREAIA